MDRCSFLAFQISGKFGVLEILVRKGVYRHFSLYLFLLPWSPHIYPPLVNRGNSYCPNPLGPCKEWSSLCSAETRGSLSGKGVESFSLLLNSWSLEKWRTCCFPDSPRLGSARLGCVASISQLLNSSWSWEKLSCFCSLCFPQIKVTSLGEGMGSLFSLFHSFQELKESWTPVPCTFLKLESLWSGEGTRSISQHWTPPGP